jgi:hypothetical protein
MNKKEEKQFLEEVRQLIKEHKDIEVALSEI